MANPIGKIKVSKEAGTEIRHAGSNKVIFRIDAALSDFDVDVLRQVISMAYNAGISDGEVQLQGEFKHLLGM